MTIIQHNPIPTINELKWRWFDDWFINWYKTALNDIMFTISNSDEFESIWDVKHMLWYLLNN